MSKPATPPSEVLLLRHDVSLVQRACQQATQAQVPKPATPDEQRYLAIAGDLWQKNVNHCQSVGLLLAHGLFESAVVMGRAVYETTITLTYLVTVGNKLRNAALFEAHMVVDTATVYAKEPGIPAAAAQEALKTIPEDILREVHANRKHRRPWSGKKLAEMAEAIKLVGHNTVYAIMSWQGGCPARC